MRRDSSLGTRLGYRFNTGTLSCVVQSEPSHARPNVCWKTIRDGPTAGGSNLPPRVKSSSIGSIFMSPGRGTIPDTPLMGQRSVRLILSGGECFDAIDKIRGTRRCFYTDCGRECFLTHLGFKSGSNDCLKEGVTRM